MTRRLRVSIVTITRNGREFIGDAIKSVVGQTYPEVEYIVIDGASSDGTVDVIRSFAGRISKWISEPDAGIADAFNKGLALSTGDYVQFLNSDDRLASPESVEKMVQAIVRADYPELIYGDCDVIDRKSGSYLYTASFKFTAGAFKRGRTLPHPGLFTKRAYFDRYGRFDSQFRIAMDYELLLRGALRSRVVRVPLVVAEFRTGGISRPGPAVAAEIVRALRKNRVIRTSFGAQILLGYFRFRAVLRRIRGMLWPFRPA